MDLETFCRRVNELDAEDCDRINSDPNELFGAEHFELPPELLEYYFDNGYTPEEAYTQLCLSLDEEGRAEALAS